MIGGPQKYFFLLRALVVTAQVQTATGLLLSLVPRASILLVSGQDGELWLVPI